LIQGPLQDSLIKSNWRTRHTPVIFSAMANELATVDAEHLKSRVRDLGRFL
jgi:hypothetical protein